jgi:heme oxygenase
MREQLRLSTRSAHERLEAVVDFDRRLTSLAAYRSFLESFFRFLQPVEAQLADLDLSKIGIDYAPRRKLGCVEADLKDLGHTQESLDALAPFTLASRLSEPLDAFGVLYVLEGSSLGRRMMLGKLAPKLNIGPHWAGRFFYGYGENTSIMWRNFMDALNKAGEAPGAASRIETSASAAFAAFETCFEGTQIQYEGVEQPIYERH